MTKAEIYEKAEAEGKEVRMCNGLGCTALGFKGDVHWMSQARKVAEGRTDRGAPTQSVSVCAAATTGTSLEHPLRRAQWQVGHTDCVVTVSVGGLVGPGSRKHLMN